MNKIKSLVLSGLVLISLSATLPALALEPSVIHVNGYAEQEITPNMAYVTLGMDTIAPNVNEAKQNNISVMNQLVHSLTTLGLEQADMKTTGFNLHPNYDQAHKRIVSYTVRNNLKVRVNNLDKLPEVLQKASAYGVNNIYNVQFSCSNIAMLKAKLVQAAVANGKHLAELAVQATGSTLGRVKEININNQSPSFRFNNLSNVKLLAKSSIDEAPQLQAGTQTISETVNMTFYVD